MRPALARAARLVAGLGALALSMPLLLGLWLAEQRCDADRT